MFGASNASLVGKPSLQSLSRPPLDDILSVQAQGSFKQLQTDRSCCPAKSGRGGYIGWNPAVGAGSSIFGWQRELLRPNRISNEWDDVGNTGEGPNGVLPASYSSTLIRKTPGVVVASMCWISMSEGG